MVTGGKDRWAIGGRLARRRGRRERERGSRHTVLVSGAFEWSYPSPFFPFRSSSAGFALLRDWQRMNVQDYIHRRIGARLPCRLPPVALGALLSTDLSDEQSCSLQRPQTTYIPTYLTGTQRPALVAPCAHLATCLAFIIWRSFVCLRHAVSTPVWLAARHSEELPTYLRRYLSPHGSLQTTALRHCCYTGRPQLTTGNKVTSFATSLCHSWPAHVTYVCFHMFAPFRGWPIPNADVLTREFGEFPDREMLARRSKGSDLECGGAGR